MAQVPPTETQGSNTSGKPCELEMLWAWMRRNPGLSILVIGLGTLFLGWWGFLVQFTLEQNGGTALDALYLAVQLFVINSGSEYLDPVPQVEIARYLAVVIIALSTIYIFYRTLNEQIRLLCLRGRILIIPIWQYLFPSVDTPGGHVVICGAGFLGSVMTCHFQREGRNVIVLEMDKELPEVKICREDGALVLHQDARSPEILRSIRVQDAAMVFALTGSDSLNVDIALACAEVARERPAYLPPLTCHIHIEDQNLSFTLRQLEFELSEHDQAHFAFFNLYHVAGRNVATCGFRDIMKTSKGAPVILIVGLGDFGKSLLVNLVKRWREIRLENNSKITVVVVDEEAESRVASLLAHFPSLNKYCDLMPFVMKVHSAEFLQGDFLKAIYPRPLNGVYICLRDEGDATSVAITLHNLLCNRFGLMSVDCTAPPIIVRTFEEHGMTRVIRELRKTLGWNIYAFPVLTDFCEKKGYGNEIAELLAKATHQNYLEREYGKGITEEENPSAVSWEGLAEDVKDQNRAQAKSLIWNLRNYGYRVVPMRYWDEPYLKFDKDDPMIEALAIREHDRYVKMKSEQGYRWGPKNDKKNKINSTLVDWEALPNDEKEKDIQTILELPGRLAQVYFKLEYYPLAEKPSTNEDQGIG